MFLKDLDDKEKKAFLYLAKKLVLIDNKLMASELSLLKNLSEEMGILVKDALEIDYINELNEIYKTKRSKMYILMELISLGYADNDFCVRENEFISGIANVLAISDKVLLTLEKWVTDEKNISASIKRLTEKPVLNEKESDELENLKVQHGELLKKLDKFCI
jgi:hypothetical protein